ncbi:helix-turn-helix domain-containing protein [Asanoa hainanensis]|uniref:helix-turn-helix domain-containing protein n=1 Tax=Asanoa hainanensis TaxID=560556 RepID=UPI0015C5A442|nr:helix-turn-helix domain-containing protein [Asanoa hainanensis]
MAVGFGELLRQHRLAQRLTQEALAEQAGISPRSIGDMERGRGRSPRPDTLDRLAGALRLEGNARLEFVASGQTLFWSNRVVRPDRPPAPDGQIRQLPADPADFVGRDAEFAVLDHILDPDAAGPRLAVISGPPGVGKSALAVHAGHRLASRFPDGQLYVVLGRRGETAVDPADALAQLLQMLGVDAAAVPNGLDARAAAFRARVAGRRVLLVLDDALGHHQVTPLLPAEGAAVLVTSRLPLTGLPGAAAVDLPPLPTSAAIELLGKVAGTQRVQLEPESAAELVAACGNLPLAVRIAAARLAARPDWQIGRLAERLADERRRLDELRHGDLAVRPTLQMAHRQLTPPAARAFALLGALGVRSFPEWVVASLLDTSPAEAAAVLDELLDARLLEPAGPDRVHQPRYRYHEMTRLFARECREAEIPDAVWTSALRRVARGWLGLLRHAGAHACCERLYLDGGAEAEAAVDPRTVDIVTGHPVDWFEAERDCLAVLIATTAAAGLAGVARDLAGGCAEFFQLRGYYDDWHRTMRAALDACRAAGDDHGVVAMLRGLGSCLVELDDWAAAEAALRESWQLAERLADPVGTALARKELGFRYSLTGHLDEAVTELHVAAGSLRRLGLAGALVITLGNLSFLLRQRGEGEGAVRHSTEAAELAEQAGDPYLIGQTSRGLAGALRAVGRLAEAELAARRSATLFERIGDLIGAAQSLRVLGEVLAEDPARAAEAERTYAAARKMFASRGYDWGLALTELSHGELAVRYGLDGGPERLHRALLFWSENEVPVLRARTLLALAVAAERSRDPAAERLLAEAHTLYRTLGISPPRFPLQVAT